jgi:pimeloyl-ACP methyl ester carboxylesterase
MSRKPSIVFCHGIWADGSCWNKLIPPLRDDGFEVIACQYGLDTVQNDVDMTIRTLGRVSGPSVLQSQQDKFPTTKVFGEVEVADGRAWMLPSGIDYFAGDLSEAEKQVTWATHYAPDADLFNTKAAGVAWRSKPSAYVVCKQDNTVNPELQRFVAKRMDASTYEVDSSHVPMLSHPDVALEAIRALVATAQGAPAPA